jgi:hypothetical protein
MNLTPISIQHSLAMVLGGDRSSRSLLTERCREEHASLVFVSHDVRVIREIADHVAVLYGGRELESGPARAVLGDPRSPCMRERDLRCIPLRPADAPQPRDGCPFLGILLIVDALYRPIDPRSEPA